MNDLTSAGQSSGCAQARICAQEAGGFDFGKGRDAQQSRLSILRRFVESGWVSKRKGSRRSADRRAIFMRLPTRAGNNCFGALSRSTDKEMRSETASVCAWDCSACWTAKPRRILAERERWLADREKHLARLSGSWTWACGAGRSCSSCGVRSVPSAMDFASEAKSRQARHLKKIGHREANMDFSSPREWINGLWILFGLYWLVSASSGRKPTA